MFAKAKKYWLILGLFILFFCARLYHLGYHDFWYDEIRTIEFARNPWHSKWDAPLYYILLHFWIKFFGISEFVLRLPGALLSFLSVILVFLLGKNLFNLKVGLFASIFMGLSPFHLWYAQEARDYNLAIFLATLSTYLFYKANKEGAFRIWIFFILVSIAGLYTHYFYILLILAQTLFLLRCKKMSLGFKQIIPLLIVVLSFSLYLPRLLNKFYFSQNEIWIPSPTLKSIIITVENFILGYNGFPELYLCANIMAAILFIMALKGIFKKELRRAIFLCIFLFSVPIIAAFFFSRQFFSIYVDRRFIIFSPYFYLVLALGITFLHKEIRWALLGFLFFILIVADYGYFNDQMLTPFNHHLGTFIKKPIKPAVKFLEDNVGPQDMVAFTEISTMPSIKFYSHGRLKNPYFFYDPRIPPDIAWHRPQRRIIPLEKISFKTKKFWVISSNWGRTGGWDDNSGSVKKWLDSHLKHELTKEFDGLYIFRYVTKEGI